MPCWQMRCGGDGLILCVLVWFVSFRRDGKRDDGSWGEVRALSRRCQCEGLMIIRVRSSSVVSSEDGSSTSSSHQSAGSRCRRLLFQVPYEFVEVESLVLVSVFPASGDAASPPLLSILLSCFSRFNSVAIDNLHFPRLMDPLYAHKHSILLVHVESLGCCVHRWLVGREVQVGFSTCWWCCLVATG